MGSAKNSSSAGRKARIEQMRRAERARDRRNRTIAIVAGSAVVVALVGVGAWAITRESGEGKSAAQGDAKGAGRFETGTDGVRTWSGQLARTHVTREVTYPMTPPVGGDHNQAWMNCDGDVYTKAIKNVHAVHSLEHGAVWVTYNSEASDADVKALAAKVERTPYTLMSPVEDQKDPIMLSAWGSQRTVKSADDPDVDAFFSRFVQGKQTPEPGAPCTSGLSQ